MGFRFIGGPYDGMVVEAEELNQKKEMLVFLAKVRRQFIIMPPLTQWQGVITPAGARTIYERHFVDGGAEYRQSGDDGLSAAMAADLAARDQATG